MFFHSFAFFLHSVYFPHEAIRVTMSHFFLAVKLHISFYHLKLCLLCSPSMAHLCFKVTLGMNVSCPVSHIEMFLWNLRLVSLMNATQWLLAEPYPSQPNFGRHLKIKIQFDGGMTAFYAVPFVAMKGVSHFFTHVTKMKEEVLGSRNSLHACGFNKQSLVYTDSRRILHSTGVFIY